MNVSLERQAFKTVGMIHVRLCILPFDYIFSKEPSLKIMVSQPVTLRTLAERIGIRHRLLRNARRTETYKDSE